MTEITNIRLTKEQRACKHRSNHNDWFRGSPPCCKCCGILLSDNIAYRELRRKAKLEGKRFL